MKNLIIGIGNSDRCDDAVGFAVTRKIRKNRKVKCQVIDQNADPAALIDLWKDADSVVLVDAVQSGSTPGTVFRIDPHHDSFPSQMFRCSTHSMGVAEAVALAKSLHQLPERFVIYGIEGKTYKPGRKITREVKQAAEEVKDLALHELLGLI